jgi:hypothetical protein
VRTAAAASAHADWARTAIQADQPTAGRHAAAKQKRKTVLSLIRAPFSGPRARRAESGSQVILRRGRLTPGY